MRLLIALSVVIGLAQFPGAPFNLRVASVDSTNPVATITAPTSGTTHDAGSTEPLTTLAGTCTDNVGVSVVTWVNDRGGSGTATGTTSWSVASISLFSGDNVLTVTCQDTSGNTHADVLTVTYTPAGSGNNCNGACLIETSFTAAQGWDGEKVISSPGTCPQGTENWTTDSFQSGVEPWSNEITPVNSNCGHVTTAANYSGGAGGRGFRSYVGDGANQGSGELALNWATGGQTNLSVCSRMRYIPQSGDGWIGDDPHYTKDFYFINGGYIILGYQGGAWGVSPGTGPDRGGSVGWAATNDGNFHEHAWYIDIAGGIIRVWVDDTLTGSWTGISFGFASFPNGVHTSNQSEGDSDGDGVAYGDTSYTDMTTDYDDIVIDTDVTNNGKLEC